MKERERREVEGKRERLGEMEKLEIMREKNSIYREKEKLKRREKQRGKHGEL